jgi:hypothetical protein
MANLIIQKETVQDIRVEMQMHLSMEMKMLGYEVSILPGFYDGNETKIVVRSENNELTYGLLSGDIKVEGSFHCHQLTKLANWLDSCSDELNNRIPCFITMDDLKRISEGR